MIFKKHNNDYNSYVKLNGDNLLSCLLYDIDAKINKGVVIPIKKFIDFLMLNKLLESSSVSSSSPKISDLTELGWSLTRTIRP